MSACIACDVYQSWEHSTSTYADRMNALLAPHAVGFLTAALGLYFTFKIMSWMAGKEIVPADLGKDVFMVAVCSYFITFPVQYAGLIDTIYTTGLNISAFFVDQAGIGADGGMAGLMEAFERPFRTVIVNLDGMTTSAGYSISAWVGSLLLMLCYTAVWMLVSISLFASYAIVVFLKALGPILLILAALPPLRGAAVSAFRLLLTLILQLAVAGITIGIAAEIIQSATDRMPLVVKDDGTTGFGNVSEWLWSTGYWSALLSVIAVGVLYIFLSLKAYHISQSAVLSNPGQLMKSVASSATKKG